MVCWFIDIAVSDGARRLTIQNLASPRAFADMRETPSLSDKQREDLCHISASAHRANGVHSMPPSDYYATFLSVTMGRCFRPPWKATESTNLAPGSPRTGACGKAQGDFRGQFAPHAGPLA